jgi:predicted phosphodiesterase
MQTTGIFTIHKYEIRNAKLNEPIYLIPFGDIHRSSPMCHEEKWHSFLGWAMSKKRAYFLGMGDYDDLASASERRILGNKDLHESSVTTIEGLYRTHTDRLAKEISFMKGRIIGLIEGNHYGEFQNGTTTTQRLAEKLDCKYLGVSSFIRLMIFEGNHQTSVDIWAHHGKGAARLIGGSLNRVQQMGEAAEADIYLMGHDHKKSVGMTTKLRLGGTKGTLNLAHKKQLYVRTGSFLKGYENDKRSYIVDSAMNPTDLGVVKIELTPERKYQDNKDIYQLDIHASI